jgi:hypothetical protein
MNTTLGELKKKILLLLGDEITESVDYGVPITGATYEASILLDAVHAAIAAIAVRVWKPNSVVIEGSVSEIDVPIDFIEVDGVYDNTAGLFLPKLALTANKTRLMGIETNAWTLTSPGTITLINALGTTGGILFYSATWEIPEIDTDVLEPPQLACTALALYAVSYCLLNQATQQATLSQFKQKVDSGDPMDIPAQMMSDFFMRRFENELSKLPMQDKGVTTR